MASMNTKRASSSSSSTHRLTYEVFLSFRGEDTRNGFTSHLYTALDQKGIYTFIDDEKLERGKSISPTLMKAIKESRFAIVILSKNYASSTWCLEELEEIIGCITKTGMTILPIFYHVNPSYVRKQTGTFEQAFDEHEEHFKESIEKVQKWRAILKEVANISGWHLPKRSEAECIQDIVEVILNKLSNTFSAHTMELKGIESRVEKLKSHLAIESNDVRIIGIWGTGGMGKTTLARAVYGMVSNKFEACYFVANVREESKKCGLCKLQKKLLKKLLMLKNLNLQDVGEGVLMMKKMLHNKKILLVLDDVTELDQLEKLAGEHCWFGSGSRIIITTRDKHLLVLHEVKEIYEAEVLNQEEALQLFSLKALKMDHPPEDYGKLSQDFVNYSKGLPLAIVVLGSFLFGKNIDEWKNGLDRLNEFPERGILDVLQISFDGLRSTEKEIFLNIACFFNHMYADFVIKILDYLELYPKIGLKVLIDKSLVKLHENQLWMHDLLQEMGRDIVHQECPKDPGKRSRLWLFKDIDNVLTKNTGTKAIQGIVLKLHEPKKVYWNPETFSKMQDLKLLEICGVQLMHDLKHLPNSLRILDWRGYPSKSLTSSFQSKSLENLKFLNLTKSLKLIEAPDIIKVPNLESLVLEGCINLSMIHLSIGVHKKLTLLNLKGCKNLKSLPRKLEMESLEILILSKCSKVKSIPEFGENMKSVSKFYLDGTAITKLPTSIGNLTGLVLLNVKDCKNLMTIPSTFLNLNSLEKLHLSGCSKLLKILGATECLEGLDETGTAKKLKKLFISGVKRRSTNPLDLSITSLSSLCSVGKLETLDLSYCNLNAIPNAICCLSTLKNLSLRGNNFGSFMQGSPDPLEMLLTSLSDGSCSLKELNLSYCNLNGFSDKIGCLQSLEGLILSGNKFGYLPESIAQLSNLFYLALHDCPSLQSLPMLPFRRDFLPELFEPYICQRTMWPIPYLGSLGGWCSYSCSQKERPEPGLDQDFLAGMYRGQYLRQNLIFGSEIPQWFERQNIGAEINIEVPSHLCDELVGIASCGVICYRQPVDLVQLDCLFICNGNIVSSRLMCGLMLRDLSDQLFLAFFEYSPRNRIRYVVNGFAEFGIRYRAHGSGVEVKECGVHLVYKKEVESFRVYRNRIRAEREKKAIEYMGRAERKKKAIEYMGRAERTERRKKQREKEIAEIKRLVAESQRRNNSIILYEGSDDCNGAGPSGEGSSTDVPHPKQIERLPELAHGDADSEGSSEYDEWGEELSDWEESSESDQKAKLFLVTVSNLDAELR